MGRRMGTRQFNRLSARTVASKRRPGLYCDGGGLYLQVTLLGSKTWIFRYRSPRTRKRRDMGLGPLHSVGLPEARGKAAAQRAALASGLDPSRRGSKKTAARPSKPQRPSPSLKARPPTSSPTVSAGGKPVNPR